VHPLWSSHEEKRPCLELPWEGSHGRSWSSMASHGELAGEEGEGDGGEGAQLGAPWGAWGGAARSSSTPATPCSFPVRDCLLYVREESRKEEGEEKKMKGRKRKEKKKNIYGKFLKLENFQGEK
jgi:hypothetical protein